jgi:hypothetical protein
LPQLQTNRAKIILKYSSFVNILKNFPTRRYLMKKCILVSSLLSLMVACSSNSGSSGNVRPAAVADTGTQSDLKGNWSQACQAGAFSGGGFAAMSGGQGAGTGAGAGAGAGTGAGAGASAGTGANAGGTAIGSSGAANAGSAAGAGAGASTGANTGANAGASNANSGANSAANSNAANGNLGLAAAVQNFLSVTDNTMVLSTKAYQSADCSGDALAEARVNFDYTIANYVAGQNNDVDMRMRSARMMMNSQAAVDAANAAKLCGLSNWRVNESRNIAGTSCLQNMPSSTGRSIFQTINYSNGNLTFGVLDQNAGASDANRPTSLASVPFTRVASDTANGDQGGQGQSQGKDQGQSQSQSQDQNQDQSKDQSSQQDQGKDQGQSQDKSQGQSQDQGKDQGQQGKDQSGQQDQGKDQGQQGKDQSGQQDQGKDQGQSQDKSQGQDKSQDKGQGQQDKGQSGQQGQGQKKP